MAHSALSHGHEKRKNGIKVKFLEDETLELPKRDPKLKFHDEAEAYERTTTPANFTSHPGKNIGKGQVQYVGAERFPPGFA